MSLRVFFFYFRFLFLDLDRKAEINFCTAWFRYGHCCLNYIYYFKRIIWNLKLSYKESRLRLLCDFSYFDNVSKRCQSHSWDMVFHLKVDGAISIVHFYADSRVAYAKYFIFTVKINASCIASYLSLSTIILNNPNKVGRCGYYAILLIFTLYGDGRWTSFLLKLVITRAYMQLVYRV